MDWSRELAVITGATSGIGKALTEGLADRGAAVAICSRNEIQVKKVGTAVRQAGGTALGMACDVRDERQVAAFAERVLKEAGTPTILINNAGVGRFAPVAEMSVATWDEVIEVNLRGMFLVTRAFLPAMLAAGRGAIVNLASLAGRSGFSQGAAYCASKHGVLGFSKSLMLEVRQRGLRVIAVCPGSVNTPFFDQETPFNPNRDKILAPEDVAQVVLDALEVPERAMVSEIDIRPSNP